MPKKVHEIAKALQRQGYSEEKAWRIANAQYKKMKSKRKGKK